MKFGKGVLVHAKDNPQLALYSIGALEKFGRDGIEEIAMTIYQPRRNHISQWVVNISELDAFAIEAKAAVENVPSVISEAASKDDAKKMKDAIEAAGATVKLS